MRYALFLVAALALAAWPAKAHDHSMMMHEGQASGQAATVEGQIVDLACYMSHGATDAKHTKCAKACVVGGSPAGLVAGDGNLYLLVEDHMNAKPYGQAKKLAGEKAKVGGKLVTKGGLSAIIVSSAEKE